MDEFLSLYYQFAIPILVAIHFANRYLMLPLYLYFNPWIRKAELSDFTGLRYLRKLLFLYTVIDPAVFAKIWGRYNLLLTGWLALILLVILPFGVINTNLAEANSAALGIGLSIVVIVPFILLTVWAIQALEPHLEPRPGE